MDDLIPLTLGDLIKFAEENKISMDAPIGFEDGKDYIRLFDHKGIYAKTDCNDECPIIMLE